MSAEVALALLLVALYLLDSLRLLRADEALLLRRGFGGGLGGRFGSGLDGWRWSARFGARGFKLAGREPYLAHLLLPHQPNYRLAWRMDHPRWTGAAAATTAAVSAPATRPSLLDPDPPLHRLAPSAWVSWGLVLVLIPLTLLAGWGVVATLAAVLLLYLNIALALVLTFLWRKALGLDGRAFALLAFECLACAPYSVNLLRRIAWQQPVREDFVDAATRLLPAAESAQVRRECLARIDERLEAEPEEGALAARLRAARARLAAHIAAAATESEATG